MARERLVEKAIEFIKELSAGRRTFTDADIEPLRSAIAEAAYYKAEKRGFTPGHELSDWLEAEIEIQGRIGRHVPMPD
jgi:hypothetical protein